MRRRGSALISALALLALATLVGAGSLYQISVWHADYTAQLAKEDQAMREAFNQWKRLPLP